MKKAQKQLNEFRERFKAMSDGELIEAFNGDVGKPGWVSARAQFHYALREEFDSRGFDYSSIGSQEKVSFDIGHKIKLIGKKIIKQNINDLNKFGNKPRLPSMMVAPDKVDQYLKETFGLTDQEIMALGQNPQPQPQPVQPVEPQTKVECEIVFVNRKPEQPSQNQPVDQLIEQLNKEAEQGGQLGQKPSEGMQVVFFPKSPEKYKRRMLDREKSKK